MSGGYFDYMDRHLDDIANSIQEEIENNNVPYGDEYSDKYFYENGNKRFSDETIQIFKKGVEVIKQAAIYAYEIDCLLCGDTGEDSFQKQISEKIKD